MDAVENVGEVSWAAVSSREQHEIMSVMDKIVEVLQGTAQRWEDEGLEEQFSQHREKIREWTQQISA